MISIAKLINRCEFLIKILGFPKYPINFMSQSGENQSHLVHSFVALPLQAIGCPFCSDLQIEGLFLSKLWFENSELYQPAVVAYHCNLSDWGLDLKDGLRTRVHLLRMHTHCSVCTRPRVMPAHLWMVECPKNIDLVKAEGKSSIVRTLNRHTQKSIKQMFKFLAACSLM